MGAGVRPSWAMMEACTAAVPREAKVPTAPENLATMSTLARKVVARDTSYR